MLRFIACVWKPDSEAQRYTAQCLRERVSRDKRWRTVLDVAGLTVVTAGLVEGAVECYELPARNGVVLGKLFARGAEVSKCRPVTLVGEVARKVVESGGRELVRSFWGQYVAITRDESAGRICVLQCPNAGRPVYRRSDGGATTYFSELSDVVGPSFKLDIDWEYVSAHIIAPMLRTEATAIQDVTELRSGHCDQFAGSKRETHVYWSVESFAETQRDNIEDCKQSLREAVKSSVDCWASCHDRIVHLLSGGLDSSIVLGCLARSPSQPEITCVTHFGQEGSGADERQFARIAAQSAGCNHIEIPLRRRVPLEEWEPVSLTPRPGFYLAIVQERQILCLARELRATAIMSGNGGDAAFCQYPDLGMARDYLHDHGVNGSLIGVIVATALLADTSVWNVARATMRLSSRNRSETNIVAACLPHRKLPSPQTIALVSKSLGRFAPSIGDSRKRIPQAKARHVLVVSQPMMARSNVADFEDGEIVDPLTGELVSESCIEIPVYVHCRNGQTRWLARDAFRDFVPPSLLNRTTKGNPEPYVDSLRDENVTELESRLMAGELVRRGLIERRSVQTALRGQLGAASATELLVAYGVELWASTIRAAQELARAA